jgi:hypothetical protein
MVSNDIMQQNKNKKQQVDPPHSCHIQSLTPCHMRQNGTQEIA